MARLDGRVVAIAGAGGSLGPALARRLADEGARLVLGGRDGARLEELAASLALPTGHVALAEADLSSAGGARAWAADIADRHGRVDAVCHLVGGWRGGTPVSQASPEEWNALAGPLVDAVRHAVAAFGAHLAAAPAGRFVLASSVQATAPTAKNAAYSAAKAAGEAFVLALADEWREAGAAATANVVQVNALVTPAMREASPEKAFRSFADVADVAEAFAYLLSDAAAKVNGRRLVLA